MKNYVKPGIISQKGFEMSALGCLKQPGMWGESFHIGSGSTYLTGTGQVGTGTFHINPGFTSTSLECDLVLNIS